MKNCIILCSAVLFCLWGPSVNAQDAVPDTTLFLQANQAYKNGDYSQAAQIYEKLIEGGLTNGELLYNLGNACLKSGDIGRAIQSYRRAERFLPRDADLEANLTSALEQTTDRIDCGEGSSFRRTFFFWYYKLSLSELGFAFIGCNGLLWLLLGIRWLARPGTLGLSIAAALFFTALFGGSFAAKYGLSEFYKTGVVLTKEVQVRSGSSSSDTVLFKLHEGAELSIAGEEGDWLKVALCDGKKGWVQKISVGILPGA